MLQGPPSLRGDWKPRAATGAPPGSSLSPGGSRRSQCRGLEAGCGGSVGPMLVHPTGISFQVTNTVWCHSLTLAFKCLCLPLSCCFGPRGAGE